MSESPTPKGLRGKRRRRRGFSNLRVALLDDLDDAVVGTDDAWQEDVARRVRDDAASSGPSVVEMDDESERYVSPKTGQGFAYGALSQMRVPNPTPLEPELDNEGELGAEYVDHLKDPDAPPVVEPDEHTRWKLCDYLDDLLDKKGAPDAAPTVPEREETVSLLPQRREDLVNYSTLAFLHRTLQRFMFTFPLTYHFFPWVQAIVNLEPAQRTPFASLAEFIDTVSLKGGRVFRVKVSEGVLVARVKFNKMDDELQHTIEKHLSKVQKTEPSAVDAGDALGDFLFCEIQLKPVGSGRDLFRGIENVESARAAAPFPVLVHTAHFSTSL